MPSSMIFASLVVLWLLILVPAVARHRQEVARPSVAALSGRVLARSPRRRSQEGTGWSSGTRRSSMLRRVVTATRTAEVRVPSARTELRFDDAEPTEDSADGVGDDAVDDVADDAGEDWAEDRSDDRLWERPPARYRAGRGGFDAEAAALTARARYAFRQRVVLAMLVLAVATGVAAGVALPVLWWAHGAVDVLLVGYLVYLRRQVRMEEAIRARRAARMAGTRRPSAADDPELDDWAERGRAATRQARFRGGGRGRRRPGGRPGSGDDGRRRGRGRHARARGRRGGATRPPAPASDAAAPAPGGHRPRRGRGGGAGPRRRLRTRLPPCGRPVGGC